MHLRLTVGAIALSLATVMIGAEERPFTPVTDATLRNPAPSD